MSNTVAFEMEAEDAAVLLDRLYTARSNDVEVTTVAYQVPVSEAIDEVEQKFPEVVLDVEDD